MRKIVIAPRESFNDLFLKYRKEDIFNDPKFFTKEDLKKERYFSYTDDAIIYLIKTRHFEYALSKKYLIAISSFKEYKGNNKKLLELVSLQKELLDKGLLISNEYFDYELDNSSIDVCYYSKSDSEVSSILKGREFIYQSNNGPIERICNHFFLTNDELFYTFNEIARLISTGVSPNDIFIYGLSTEDALTINRLKDYYGLNINGLDDKKLIDEEISREFLNNFSKDNNLQNIIEKYSGDPNLDFFMDIVNKYEIEGLSKEEQRKLYIDVFKVKTSTRHIYKDAITHIRNPIVGDNQYLFIVNFVQGLYPTIKKDEGILDDKDNIELGLSSLEQLNFDNNEFYKNALNQHAHIYVSYSSRNASGPLYVSPLKKDLNLTFNESPISKHLYSAKEANIEATYHFDLYKDFLVDSPLFRAYKSLVEIPYMGYSNKYNKVEVYPFKQVIKLSYSSLKAFYQCQYKYYLNYVLKVDEFEDSYVTQVGKLSHYILEHMDDKKSFDELYKEAKEKYGKDFNVKENFLLEIRKPHFEKAFNYIKEQEEHVINRSVKREDSKFSVPLSDYLLLEGRIDKYVIFGDAQQYVYVVDYKSGSEEFKESLIQYGLSLQLPIYAVLVSKTKEFEDKQIAGLFIQKTYNKSAQTCKIDDEKYYEPLKLTGVFLDSYKMIQNLDDELSDPNNVASRFIASCKLKNPEADGYRYFNNSSKRHKSEDWFNNVIDLASKLAVDASNKILNNEFEINPKYIGDNNASCNFCPYRDICFKTIFDAKFITNEEEKDE